MHCFCLLLLYFIILRLVLWLVVVEYNECVVQGSCFILILVTSALDPLATQCISFLPTTGLGPAAVAIWPTRVPILAASFCNSVAGPGVPANGFCQRGPSAESWGVCLVTCLFSWKDCHLKVRFWPRSSGEAFHPCQDAKGAQFNSSFLVCCGHVYALSQAMKVSRAPATRSKKAVKKVRPWFDDVIFSLWVSCWPELRAQ